MTNGSRQATTDADRPEDRRAGATCLAYAGGAGIGDQLMLSTVARELKRRGHGRVFVLTEYPDLFRHNADVDGSAIRESRQGESFVEQSDRRCMDLTYLINYNLVTEERDQPPDPILAYLCRMVGVTGRVDLRPYVTLSDAERDWGEPYRDCIAVQSSGVGARSSFLNKEWLPGRFAEVAAHLIKSHPIVQVGSPGDPPVPCTHDLRGRTSLRQLASVLSHCRMLVGLVGMPMHMARAVDCPSVIVYGGRERPDQTGYICNENIYRDIPCSPCWLDRRCDFGRVCLDSIAARDVIEAAERLLARPRDGLAVASYEISGGPAGSSRRVLADPPVDRSPALRAAPPPEAHPDGPNEPERPPSTNKPAKGASPLRKLAKGALAVNLAAAIRMVRFGPGDAGWRLVAAYRQINPFGGRVDESEAMPASDKCLAELAVIPEVELKAVVRGRPLVRMDPGQRSMDGAMPLEDVMALLAVLVDRAPRAVLEVGTFHGHTTRLMALNLPSATIHTVDLPEDPDAAAQASALAKDDLHLIASRRVGIEYRSDPSITNVVQHFGDTATWDFRAAEGATFYIIDASHNYEYVRNDTSKALVAARGRDVTVLWHDCDQWHPGIVRWIKEMAMAGYPVRRIAGTHLAILDVSA